MPRRTSPASSASADWANADEPPAASTSSVPPAETKSLICLCWAGVSLNFDVPVRWAIVAPFRLPSARVVWATVTSSSPCCAARFQPPPPAGLGVGVVADHDAGDLYLPLAFTFESAFTTYVWPR